ncbi:hypothetical protein ACE6H2_023561 [Prunus campanulata]
MERFGSLSKTFLSPGSVQLMVKATPIFLLLKLEFSRDLKRVEKLRKINELLGGFIGSDNVATDCSMTEFPQKSSASNTHGRSQSKPKQQRVLHPFPISDEKNKLKKIE